jgi:hypothetical protein
MKVIDWNREVQYVRRPGHKRLVPRLISAPIGAREMPAVFAMPVVGGAMREVPSGSLEAEDTEQLVTAGADTYRIEFRKISRLAGLSPLSPTGRPTGTYAGGTSSFHIVSTAAAPLPRTVVYRQEAEERVMLLHPVSPSVSPASATLTYPMGYVPTSMYLSGSGNYLQQRVSVSGDIVYWVSVFPDERVERIGTDGKSAGETVYRYKTAIMAAQVHGGAAHKLLDGLPDSTFLLPSQDGVLCWKDDTLWRLHVDRAPSRILTGVTPVHVSEWNGHLFWAETHGAGSDKHVTLMQANADGSDPHLLLETPQYIGDFDFMRYGTFHARPRVHRGHLYCLLLERDTRHLDSSGVPSLYRLKTSPAPALEQLCALPQEARRCWFDGEFLYCLALEDRLSDFSLRTDSKSSVPRIVFYRYRLPAE